MSTEEDTELRDLVAQTLEINGCLPKIRAELRASIFLALDEDENVQKKEPLLNKKIKAQLETREGQIMFCLVREFLEFFNLDFTISVYEPESYLGTAYQYEGRLKIIEDLGISQLLKDGSTPLLFQLIKIAQSHENQTKNIDINLSKIQNENCINDNDCNSILESSNKFKEVDVKDKSSSVSTEDLDHSNSTNKEILNNPILDVQKNLNETFDVSSPSITHNESNQDNNKDKSKSKTPSVEVGHDLKISDDTYDGTSSIAEDSIRDLDKISPLDTEFSPPILKDSKSHSKFDTTFEKLKRSPQKTEKIKAKTSLSSLADLPPLQLNKSRNDTVLLPSLYSKEFKDRTNNQNSKELDRFFEVEVDPLDNYEEDFMSESEINLNKSLDLRSSILEELESTDSNKNPYPLKNPTTLSSPGKNPPFQNNQNPDKEKTLKTEELSQSNNTNGIKSNSNSNSNSTASDEINLNVDDILTSPTSNES